MSTLKTSRRTAIVIDSAASLPTHLTSHPLLEIVPMRLNIANATYEDGKDLTTSDFYTLLRRAPGTATTSSPSPTAFSAAFELAARQAGSILCIVVATQFSATADAARAAIGEFQKNHPNHQVTVLDSQSAAGGQGLLATESLRRAEAGESLTSVTKAAEHVRDRIRLIASVDTLFYLWKGGRVPRLAHAGASLLRIKPTFEMYDSEIVTVARPRTAKRALSKLVELMADRIAGLKVHACVMHAASGEAAEELYERVQREFDCVENYVSEFSPVMGAHIGPGLLGIAFWPEQSESCL